MLFKNKLLKLTLISLNVVLLCSFETSNPMMLQSYKSEFNINNNFERHKISQTNNLIYPGEKKSQTYDLIYPVDYTKKKYPVFIWIHGGGFSAGDKSDDTLIVNSIAEMGYVVANLNYTLVEIGKPETALPTSINDIKNFILFASNNLKNINADLDTAINIGGASAGAYLAFMQVVNPKTSLPVRCVVNAFGPNDLSDLKLRPEAVKIANIGLSASDTTIPSVKEKQNLSPLYKIQNFQAAVTLILHSENDTLVPINQSYQLEHELVDRGFSVISNYDRKTKSSNPSEINHNYSIETIVENLQVFLSTEVCKNPLISLTCSQEVENGKKINCMTHFNSKNVKSFQWIINGKKAEDSINKLAYRWNNIAIGTHSAQIEAIDHSGKSFYSNLVTKEIK